MFTYDPRWPTWESNGIRYALTMQTDDSQLVVLFYTGTEWNSWGAFDDTGQSVGGIIGDINDQTIMEHGSLHAYLTWALGEAMRRATLHSNVPKPDPANRIERARYNLMKSVRVLPGPQLQLAPAPLP